MTTATTRQTDLELTVEAGAAWLDRVKPGWPQLIDLQRLDMSMPTSCVLGQVFEEEALHDDYTPSGYTWALDEHDDEFAGDPELDSVWQNAYGFEAMADAQYPELQAAWRQLIEDRFRGGRA